MRYSGSKKPAVLATTVDHDFAAVSVIQIPHKSGINFFPKYFVIQKKREDHTSSCSSSDKGQANPASSL